MGRIDPKLVVQGEESSLKTVKFKGETSIEAGHSHKFIVYEDDTVEIIKAIKIRPTHSNILNPGLGVGGYCLTKDPYIYGSYLIKQLLNFSLLKIEFGLKILLIIK